MPSVEVEAKKLRAKDTAENGRTPTWPPCEATAYLQIKEFPRALLDELRVLAIRKQRKLPEIVSWVVAAGLQAVDETVDKSAISADKYAPDRISRSNSES